MHSYLPDADLGVLQKAYDFAEKAHHNQMRKSGEPYFVHPVAVATALADMQLDVASVCAGLLHDVCEDTETPIEEIGRQFGGEVAELVDGLTKLGKINFYSKEDRQAESIRKMVVAMSKDVRVLLVKLCDRLDNMRTLEHMKAEAQERIARETTEIYAPLAHRLGMNQVKSELEDLSLRYLDPHAFAEIESKLKAGHKERSKYIEGLSRTLRHLLGERGLECKVLGRPRHVTSVYRRMRDLKCEFEQLHDLMAFQVCVESVSDCYMALGVVHSRWLPVPGRFKDYIALPKHNRYQSLHTTVMGPGHKRLEIQIRTHEMHRVAEKGVLAHWEYRAQASGRVRPEDAAKYSWLRELENLRDLKDPVEFLEMIKSDLFPDEVFVFTPKGDLRMFPRGATPIDFAYSIHTELGDHCSGARVNGTAVANSYKLHNGDVVHVLSEQTVTPAKDWLDSCTTTRARNRVRSVLRAQNRKKSINLGRELLEGELQRSGMSLTKLFKTTELLNRLLSEVKVQDTEDLLLSLGFGKLDAHDVVEIVEHLKSDAANSNQPSPELKTGTLEKWVRKFTGRDVDGIRVDGMDNKLVRYAKCCNPLPGDPIIGFITRGRGVAVHRRDCTKAFDTTDPERRVGVVWSNEVTINRPVSLKVLTKNTPGILADVTQVFSAHKINLSEVNCHASDDGSAQNVFAFLAKDVHQVRNVMRAISKVSGVVSVERE
ncbi:MAG TPA: bifunctional (p)ppGpp synthetase/guanosine-3',5'-bis(diphosphate) 3'-pyrophosphohydrolase [Polyangiaceae bacterium]|nr:bifunctional (p)ppGpp synthetase/guanosine-3',5'-bis(diphosphate) 3'-pyrophosphohydrolase [Polyangiaceae bacterium]